MSSGIFAIAGLAVGIAQAGLLARAAAHGPHPLGLLVRVGLVASVLVVAAVSGHLLAAAAGWLLGFAAAVVVARRRWG